MPMHEMALVVLRRNQSHTILLPILDSNSCGF
jgi:hypothetical protein